jgi:hypothetical protein
VRERKPSDGGVTVPKYARNLFFVCGNIPQTFKSCHLILPKPVSLRIPFFHTSLRSAELLLKYTQ